MNIPWSKTLMPRLSNDEERGQAEGFTSLVESLEAKADSLRDLLHIMSETTAVIDEVDWVLHPLKSETNFPIGKRRSFT